MTAPSYASAAAAAAAAAAGPVSPSSSLAVPGGSTKFTLSSQVQELAQPPPTSMTLTATLQLLTPLSTATDVYLVPRSYIQNWLVWAYHQTVPKTEATRVEAAVRLAASHLGLEPPILNMEYIDPGPIDSSMLSIEGHLLLLRPNVEAVDGSMYRSVLNTPDALRRVKSLPLESFNPKSEESEDKPLVGDLDNKEGKILCSAVPEKFYEILRAVHGVICSDGFSISFQPYVSEADEFLHHHATHHSPQSYSSQLPPKSNGNGHPSSSSSSSSMQNGIMSSADYPPRPIEFRRKVILVPEMVILAGDDDSTSPMTKLLKEEQKRQNPRMVARVEEHPMKIHYLVVGKSNPKNPKSGFVLVSKHTLVYDTLRALLRVAAPSVSTSCKRIWSKRDNKGTHSGDGFELVHLDDLDGKLQKKDEESEIPRIVVGEWMQRHGSGDFIKEVEVLIETKRSIESWPRKDLELENRIKVGDFVDAQDGTGKWYEALVREVTDDSVSVHYFGWASKWDSTIRRRKNICPAGVSVRVLPPAPLWSHSNRWREKLSAGKVVEVRDASSRADRPKWYKGEVVRVMMKNEKAKPMEGGAEVELFDDPNSGSNGNTTKKPLLLLNMTQQVLVEVDQERSNSPMEVAAMEENASVDTLKPQPPYLRYVYLYGEEICEAGTHMKIDPDPGVVTLRYEYDAGRKPVEIMKSFNNMFGSGFVKESLRGTPPAPGSVGMHNLGNSCFLNSIVQCLNHMEPVTQYFLMGTYHQDLNRRNPLGSGGYVATAYAGVLRDIWGGKYSALAPRLLKQTVASFAPQFNNSYQHDSQEFCQFLMDGLHEDCNRVKNKPYVEELEGFGMDDSKVAIETWRKHLLRHDSIIVDYCQGMHRSHLTCPVCGRESVKFDVFSTISLPVSKDKNTTAIRLEDCIEKFMEGEQLDELNAWYCPNCKKHVCALKMIALWSVPDILILHLKRFTFDQCVVSNQVLRSKIDDTVKFPIEGLDLRQHVLGPIDENCPPIYNLCGVSEHSGVTANSGHYTATVRNSKDGRWYRYNDAHVGETTGDASVTGGAYLLFYKRAKGSAIWAGMKKVLKDRGIDPYGGLETDQDGFTKVKTKKKGT